jgi:hypothetical protein
MSENDVTPLQTEGSWVLEPTIPKETPVESGKPTNIFDDFINENSQEAKDLAKEKEAKNLYDYIAMVWKWLQTLFVIALITVAVLFWYVFIQNSESDTFANSQILDPFCFFITGDVRAVNASYCSPVTYTKNSYEAKLRALKDEQARGILANLSVLYERENFLKWKDVSFIIEETRNRMRVIEILNRFDALKKEYLWTNKTKIQCGNMNLSGIDRTLEVTCDAYSQGYEGQIIWYTWDRNDTDVSWTSLSVANSFLNYIEKSSTDFTMIDRQRLFSIENVVGDIWNTTGYTNRTTFNFKLKINF